MEHFLSVGVCAEPFKEIIYLFPTTDVCAFEYV